MGIALSQSAKRYSRAVNFSPLGLAGQLRIEQARILICGCGALGSVVAERLVRSGVGYVRIVDRDWVEESNLQRQALFTQKDADQGIPKALAAAEALRSINPTVQIEPVVEDITWRNIARLSDGVQLVMDGTDNFETRFLINDFCCSMRIPWIHGGVLGASGQVMAIVPGKTHCFRCLVPELPSREAMPTCDTAGVLASAVGVVANLQAAEAIKVLSGNWDAVSRELIVVDTWNTMFRQVSLGSLENTAQCPTCGRGEYPFLDGSICSSTTVLCGKNAVQIDAPVGSDVPDLAHLESKIAGIGHVVRNAFLLRLQLPDHRVTVFRDGRIIVDGTTDPAVARTLVAKVMGA